MTPQRSSAKSRARAVRVQAGISGALVIVLLAPRIIRLFYPEIWVEDDFYLESAYLVAAGMRPYVDFVHPHLPLLEWFAAVYIKVFGASIMSLEILNEAAIFAASLLTFAVARRAVDRRTAAVAAILYAFSSLVFRYHMYERECFVTPLVLWAVLIAIDGVAARGREMIWLGALLAAACAIKLTAVIPAAVLIAYVAFVRRNMVRAVGAGAALLALIGALSAFCYWRYGFDFFYQVFIFHFLKGRDTTTSTAAYPGQIFDILAPLFVIGIIAIAERRQIGRALGLVLAMVAAEYAFFGWLSPTAWAHDYLTSLPFIAIVAAVGAMRTWSALRAVVTEEVAPRADWFYLVGGSAFILICLVWLTPLENQNWLHGSVYGFGCVPRSEVAQLAEAVDRATGPDDQIIAPSFLCFAANRIQLIRFPETYGVYREGKAELARDGFWRARAHLSNVDFFKLIEETAHFWSAQISRAIANRTVKVVINDSPVQMLPIVRVPESSLLAHGYRPEMETEHYMMWVRGPAPSASPSAPSASSP